MIFPENWNRFWGEGRELSNSNINCAIGKKPK